MLCHITELPVQTILPWVLLKTLKPFNKRGSVLALHLFYNHNIPLFLWLFGEVEVHFVVYVLALWIEALKDLCQHVDSLLTAQAGALSLELLQQVFSGHWFTDQVAADCFLCQLHITVG